MTRRALALILALLGLIAPAAAPARTHHHAPPASPTVTAAAAVTAQRQLIPLYLYPGPTWDYACAHAAPGSVLIANPSNGPGKRRSVDYAQQIDVCHSDGQHVIGYVDTLYGRRTLATVEGEIDKWYSFYSNLDGIFLDEMSHSPGDATNKTDKATADTYYRTLFNHTKAKDATRNTVVENPGDAADTSWQLAYADLVVVFEGPFNDGTTLDLQHYTAPAWVTSYPDPNRIGMLTFATPLADFPAACNTMKADGAGVGFVESDPTGHWDNPLSTQEIDANRTYCG